MKPALFSFRYESPFKRIGSTSADFLLNPADANSLALLRASAKLARAEII